MVLRNDFFHVARPVLALPRGMRGGLLCLIAAFGVSFSPAHAGPQIGVTAALRGEVVRTASLETGAAIGQMSSGQKVFLGDDIKVGSQGRLQVMLLDETIFTLGANSVMRIDEFVYNPANAATARLSTSISQGAFRFVSGQIARAQSDAMKVNLPAATIGVRGTSVAGNVAADGSAEVILLGPAPDNSLGLPAGAINVANPAGDVDITRPGFVTQIDPSGQAPAAPVQATPNQIRNLERALSEEATSELAEGLGVSVEAITVSEGTDSDGDGQLDSFSANENLAAAIRTATGANGGVTDNAELVEQVANTLFGADNIAGLSEEERGDMFRGLTLGEDLADLLAGDFDYLGPTTLAQLADFGPNGRVTFTGSGADLVDLNGADAGTFALTQVWDFANDEVANTIGGNFSLNDGQGNVLAGTFNDEVTQTLSFAEASGVAMVNITTSFSAMMGPNPGDATVMTDPHVFAEVGGSSYDREGNVEIAGTRAMYHGPGADSMNGSILESRLGAFATLSDTGEQVLIDNTNSQGAYQLDIRVNSFLSNVDRKDGTSSTASFGEGGVNVTLRNIDYTDGDATTVNEAEGSIFAMKRTISE